MYNNNTILIFSFKFLFTLNNTISPTPALTNKPAINVATVIKPSKYNWVIITEAAQFGISPTIPAITGPKIGLLEIKIESVSSPIKCIIVLITNISYY